MKTDIKAVKVFSLFEADNEGAKKKAAVIPSNKW
jgi:hypothetical protein